MARIAVYALASCIGLGCGARHRVEPSLAVAPPAAPAAFPSGPAPFAPLVASAPPGIDYTYLGTPIDVRFAGFAGPAGATLFPAAPVHRERVDQVDVRVHYMQDSFELGANARAWGAVSGGLGSDHARRFAAYRAFNVEYVDTLDDRSPGRAPPGGAVAYLSKIYYGHLYEAVLSGSEDAFHAGLKLQLPQWGLSIKKFAAQRSLDFQITASGSSPPMAGSKKRCTRTTRKRFAGAFGPQLRRSPSLWSTAGFPGRR